MVYESDFYTTRRPYRSSPNYSTYNYSYNLPSTQVRILPGLGKVHVVHTYDRIVPYVGHKRLTQYSDSPKYYSTRPSIIWRELDRIQYKMRPNYGYSYTNTYLNSPSSVRINYIRNPVTGSLISTYPEVVRPTRSYFELLGRPRLYYLLSRPSYYYNNVLTHPIRWYRHLTSPWRWYDLGLPSSLLSTPSLSYRYWLSTPYTSYYPNWLTSPYWTPSRWYNWVTSPSKLFFDSYLNDWSTSYPLTHRYYPYYSPLTYQRYYRYLPYSYPLSYYNSYTPYTWRYPSTYSSYYYPLTYSTTSSPRLYYDSNGKPYSYYDYSTRYYRSVYDLVGPSLYYSVKRPSSIYYDLLGRPSLYWHTLTFNDETSRIRAKAASLLKSIHAPSIRPLSNVAYYSRYSEPILTSRIYSDDYIYRMLTPSPTNPKVQITAYVSEPSTRWIGPSHFAGVTYAGGKAYGRRPNLTYLYEDPVKNDINLMSYYIAKFRKEKALAGREAPLSVARPSRHFSKPSKFLADPMTDELKALREARATRLANIHELEVERPLSKPARASPVQQHEDSAEKLRQQQEEKDRLAEERAMAEEEERRIIAKKQAARKAELARQEELAAQAAAERAERIHQEELAKQAEIERLRQEEEEHALLEEQRRAAELARAEEEREHLLRLEEIARQAEEERERELARQAEELAEMARQEAELAEQQLRDDVAAEEERRENERLRLAREEAELAELQAEEEEQQRRAKAARAAARAREEAEWAQLEAEEAERQREEDQWAPKEDQYKHELPYLPIEPLAPSDDEDDVPIASDAEVEPEPQHDSDAEPQESEPEPKSEAEPEVEPETEPEPHVEEPPTTEDDEE